MGVGQIVSGQGWSPEIPTAGEEIETFSQQKERGWKVGSVMQPLLKSHPLLWTQPLRGVSWRFLGSEHLSVLGGPRPELPGEGAQRNCFPRQIFPERLFIRLLLSHILYNKTIVTALPSRSVSHSRESATSREVAGAP